MVGTIRSRAPLGAAGSPEVDAERSPRATLIAQVLDALRFQGWFFCVSHLSAPWALCLPGGRLAAVHAVLEGDCVLTLEGDPAGVRLAAVEFESVTLDRGGALEQLYIDQSGSAADAAPPRQDKK